ncbi:hypothetical protein CBR_g54074 [Chara braunii]|uniref:DUF659 domain-containing protein n=1 Tax=Chara braunii TaxID=69332 RepID=A0A388MBN7_CHABU|nr:hypothetical protein CBR_g54074 [Chara braunii]|eukprot:GBG91978.1 hypothetical protein CBR_g54074 [Chara braunii]
MCGDASFATRTGSASRLRDHFLKCVCNVTLLRGTISKDELLRREQGRDVAIAELGGALTGAGVELDLSSSEDEIDTEDAITTVALTKSSTTHGKQTKIVDSATIITGNEETQHTVDDWMTAGCVPFNMMRSMYWDHMVKALMNAPKSFQYAKFDEVRTKRVAVTRKWVFERMEQLRKEWPGGWLRQSSNTFVSASCTAHSVDLMLEQFGKIGWVDVILKKSTEVVKFFMNHSRVRDLLLVNSHGAILARPGATRFATNFIMLDNVQDLYLPLRMCLTNKDWKDSIVLLGQRHLFAATMETILDNDFWAGVEKVQKTSEKLLQLLKLSDGVGRTISKIYGSMDAAVESLRSEECFTKMEREELEEIIMRRWNTMTSPLDCATVFLDPSSRTRAWKRTLRWNQHLLDKLEKKPVEKEDPKKKPWRDGVGGLTAEQLCEDAKKRAEDCEDEDDNDDDGAHDNGAKASTIARQRATSNLLELERELNKELPSWRKAIRPSKYLARLHLEESQHEGKTMASEHAEKYINARAQACAPNVKAPAKTPSRRSRKVAHVQGTEADEEQAAGDAKASERGRKQDAGLEVAAKGPEKRPKGRPRKVLREEEVQVEARETGEEAESSQKSSTEAFRPPGKTKRQFLPRNGFAAQEMLSYAEDVRPLPRGAGARCCAQETSAAYGGTDSPRHQETKSSQTSVNLLALDKTSGRPRLACRNLDSLRNGYQFP